MAESVGAHWAGVGLAVAIAEGGEVGAQQGLAGDNRAAAAGYGVVRSDNRCSSVGQASSSVGAEGVVKGAPEAPAVGVVGLAGVEHDIAASHAQT